MIAAKHTRKRNAARFSLLVCSCLALSFGISKAYAEQSVVKTKVKVDKIVPVDAVTVTDDVYSNVNSDVPVPTPVQPAVVAPVDVLKAQINTRMNGDLMAGKLTNDHADEIRAMLDDLSRQEAEFKLADAGHLSQPAINNLVRKYNMISLALTDFENRDVVSYMGNFELRRAGLQRRIYYHVATGDITPVEGEQLLNALSAVSDVYNNERATGGALTAAELESLHRDLSLVYAKMSERCGAKLAFVAPATYDKLAELKDTLARVSASHRFTPEETKLLAEQYNGLVFMQDTLAKSEGLHSADLAVLAEEIGKLNFILTRELHDRQIAGSSNKL